MGLIPTAILASQLLWKVEPSPLRTICPIFRLVGGCNTTGAANDGTAELRYFDQVLRELRPDEGPQQPSPRDLRHNYRRYDFLS